MDAWTTQGKVKTKTNPIKADKSVLFLIMLILSFLHIRVSVQEIYTISYKFGIGLLLYLYCIWIGL